MNFPPYTGQPENTTIGGTVDFVVNLHPEPNPTLPEVLNPKYGYTIETDGETKSDLWSASMILVPIFVAGMFVLGWCLFHWARVIWGIR